MCDRKDCENVCCDNYSPTFGYLCNECFQEMKKSGKDIQTFMNSSKVNKENNFNYDEEFQSRDGDLW